MDGSVRKVFALSLFAFVALCPFSSTTAASEMIQAAGCKAIAWGGDWAIVHDAQQNDFLYLAEANSPDWQMYVFSFHGYAGFAKKGISNQSFAQTRVEARIDVGALHASLSSADVGKRFSDFSGYIYNDAGISTFDHIEVQGKPWSLKLGDFSGWAVKLTTSKKGVVDHDVIDAIVSDGCGTFALRITATPSNNAEPISVVQDLLNALKLTKAEYHGQPFLSDGMFKAFKVPPKRSAPARLATPTLDEFHKAIGLK